MRWCSTNLDPYKLHIGIVEFFADSAIKLVFENNSIERSLIFSSNYWRICYFDFFNISNSLFLIFLTVEKIITCSKTSPRKISPTLGIWTLSLHDWRFGLKNLANKWKTTTIDREPASHKISMPSWCKWERGCRLFKIKWVILSVSSGAQRAIGMTTPEYRVPHIFFI